MQTSIQTQLEIAIAEIKANLKVNHDNVRAEQEILKQDLTVVNNKIVQLEHNFSNLQAENEDLKRNIENLKINPDPKIYSDTEDKVLVLHGLTENYWETESDLTNRITNILYESLNINVTGYIEEISFIGKNDHRRPIKIEFISKRICRHLLEYASFLENTGLSITRFLSASDLKKKRELRRALLNERQNGNYAIIRNNQLIVNGKAVDCAAQTINNNKGHRKNSTMSRDTRSDSNRLRRENTRHSSVERRAPAPCSSTQSLPASEKTFTYDKGNRHTEGKATENPIFRF